MESQKSVDAAPSALRCSSGNLDRFGCLNNTIKVAAGHYVDLANPDPASIEIRSIAAALSKICRFGGHCPRFYSVAEHCVHAAMMAFDDGLWTNEAIKSILLHDAAEAYIGDMVKPLKLIMPGYQEAEARIERAIEVAFGISMDHAVVKDYDRAMLKAEKQALWPEDSERWAGFDTIALRKVPFGWWTPIVAEQQFLDAARQFAVA